MPDRASRIKSLDSVRGLAALTVVLNHVWESIRDAALVDVVAPWPITVDTLTHPYFWLTYSPLQVLVAGTPAVMLFFILSGFVLSIPWHLGTAPTYRSFVVRRFCRIYLPFAAAILGSLLLVALMRSSTPGANPWHDYWQKYVVTVGLVLQHLAMTIEEGLVLDPPTWSLVYEMRISLIFPIIILAYLRYGMRRTLIATCGLYLLTWVALRFTNSGGGGQDDQTLLSSVLMTLHYVPFFVAGIVMAAIYLHRGSGWLSSRSTIRWSLWAVAIVAMFPVWWRLSTMGAHLMYGIGGTLLIALSLSSSATRRFLAHGLIEWLGRVSYSLYLVHMPLLYLCLCILDRWLPTFVIYIIALILIAAASEASYRWVELPSVRLGRHLSRLTTTNLPALRY